MLSNISLVISIGRACQSLMESILWRHTGNRHACVSMLRLQTVCDSGACTVSVVVPDLFSLFSPKLNLKQGLLSDPEGYMFALIKTISRWIKTSMLGTRRGGCFSLLDAEVFWEDGTAPTVCVKKHVEGEFLFDHDGFCWSHVLFFSTTVLDTFTPAKYNHSFVLMATTQLH